MRFATTWICRLICLSVVILVNPFIPGRLLAGEEERVKEAFKALETAIKAKDTAKIWNLLDADSQAAADRAAKIVQGAYNKADADGKTRLEKKLDVPGAELAKLTGEGFLKTKLFHSKYHEIPGSTITKVTPQGNTAIVEYTEEDGDKEKLQFVLKDGEWKVTAPMPPVQ